MNKIDIISDKIDKMFVLLDSKANSSDILKIKEDLILNYLKREDVDVIEEFEKRLTTIVWLLVIIIFLFLLINLFIYLF